MAVACFNSAEIALALHSQSDRHLKHTSKKNSSMCLAYFWTDCVIGPLPLTDNIHE